MDTSALPTLACAAVVLALIVLSGGLPGLGDIVTDAQASAHVGRPVAQIWWTPANPDPGETVTFDGSYSYDEDGNVTAYRWNLDAEDRDQNSSEFVDASGPRINWTFNSSGQQKVELEVEDDDGKRTLGRATLGVGGADSPDLSPKAVLIVEPERPSPGGTVTFDGTHSVPAPGAESIVKYEFTGWEPVEDVDDYQEDEDGVQQLTDEAAQPDHVGFRVTDSAGNQDWTRIHVRAKGSATQYVPSPLGNGAALVLAGAAAALALGRRRGGG